LDRTLSERVETLHWENATFEIRPESPIQDFETAMNTIYGAGEWNYNDATLPVEIFVPSGQIQLWVQKVGFVKSKIFGCNVLFLRFAKRGKR
jgi:hypothetical protein